jgi:hypothetical protein
MKNANLVVIFGILLFSSLSLIILHNYQTQTPNNWKTYLNSDYGFSFNYPANLTPNIESHGEGLAVNFSGVKVPNVFISVSRYDDSLEAMVNIEKARLSGHLNTTINRESGLKVSDNNAYMIVFDSESEGERSLVIFKKGQYLYNLSSDSKLINKILSSFKFDIATKTFSGNGISFSYPANWYAKSLDDTAIKIFLENKPVIITPKTELYTSISIEFAERKSLEEHIRTVTPEFKPETIKRKYLQIGGKKAIEISGSSMGPVSEGNYEIVTIIQLDKRLMIVSLIRQEYKDVYNQVLSTLKFNL